MTHEHSPLLQMRLLVPLPSSHTLPRPELLATLANTEARLVLVSAPAGFGKTTLLASWCHELVAAGVAVAWLTLETGDNEPTRFLAYLRAALAAAIGAWPEADPGAEPHGDNVEPALTALLNALAAHAGPIVLVLDDLQRIQAPAVYATIAFLLEHLPPQARLALASRADPPLHLALLRARGTLIELRAAELRFTATELEAFFRAAGLELSAEELDAVDHYVEGWPAGCQLITLAAKSGEAQAPSTDPGAIPRSLPDRIAGSQAHLFALLAEEVFAGQPAHRKAFLLQTAILDQLNGSLCDAVLGIAPAAPAADSYSQRILDELEHANLFVRAVDGERRWFRVHQLFRAFLQEQLAHEPPELLATLHRRASSWYDGAGQIVPALAHALAGDDGNPAARLSARRDNYTLVQKHPQMASPDTPTLLSASALTQHHAVEASHRQATVHTRRNATIGAPAGALERALSEPYAASALEPLSAREHEVLDLVARGASNQEIAERLVVSLGTVKCHLNHILGKLGARSRTEAVARARIGGLLP